jgi:hypothetical protein
MTIYEVVFKKVQELSFQIAGTETRRRTVKKFLIINDDTVNIRTGSFHRPQNHPPARRRHCGGIEFGPRVPVFHAVAAQGPIGGIARPAESSPLSVV